MQLNDSAYRRAALVSATYEAAARFAQGLSLTSGEERSLDVGGADPRVLQIDEAVAQRPTNSVAPAPRAMVDRRDWDRYAHAGRLAGHLTALRWLSGGGEAW